LLRAVEARLCVRQSCRGAATSLAAQTCTEGNRRTRAN
jgi:hypothetical protein